MKEKKEFGIRYFIIYSLIIYLVILVISFLGIYLFEKNTREIEFNEAMTHERNSIDIEEKLLGNELSMLIADLLYLNNLFSGELKDHDSYEEIIEHWVEFSFQHGIYDQIRYIDQSGDERIRVNLTDGKSYAVDEEELQNKADRYYFTETKKLPEGDVYVSPVDLNIENGTLEVPYKPMIRLSTPIYSTEGEFAGIIIINYLAENSLETFRSIANESYGTLVLLNGDGGWISSGDVRRDWNFMFEGREELNFAWYYDEWDFIGEGSGQEVTETGLFTYTRVDLKDKIRSQDKDMESKVHLADGSWCIVSYIERGANPDVIFVDQTLPFIINILKSEILLMIVIFLASPMLGYLLYLYAKSYRKTKIYSEYDSLTKMLNRRTGTKRLETMLSEKERRKMEISLCFLDVNGLKQVNDILGHKMGDQLLQSVAYVIKNSIRENDFVARMGGDEFIVVFSDIGKEVAENIWGRIYDKFEEINETEDRPYAISVSHGIVSCDKDSKPISSEEFIKQADALMYEQKRVMKQGLDVIRK